MAQKKEPVRYWEVTVELPDRPSKEVFLRPGEKSFKQAKVEPIAVDKLQASHRAANMLGLRWQKSVRYMTVRGPYKALASRIKEWNREYPAWSTEG